MFTEYSYSRSGLRSSIRSERGMTMIEVLVMLGIISIIMAGIGSVVTYSSRSARSIEQKTEAVDLGNLIDTAIFDRNVCGLALRNGLASNSFATPSFAPVNLNNIRNCDPANPGNCMMVFDPSSATALQTGMTVQTMQVVSTSPTSLGNLPLHAPIWSASYVAPPSNPVIQYRRYGAQIQIVLRKTNATESNGPAGIKAITKNITLLVNPNNNQVDMCFGQLSPESTCGDLMGGIYDPTKNPACQIRNVAMNSNNLWLQDIANGTAHSVVIAERTLGGRNNLALYGRNPGIAFGPNTTAATAPPALDSGSSFMYHNSNQNRFYILPSATHNADLELNSRNGDVNILAGGTAGIFIPNSGNISVGRDMNASGHRIYAAAFTVSSDRRLKYDVQPIENALDAVLQLEAKTYIYNNMDDQSRHSGFIAQDMQKVIPHVVTGDSKTDYLSINYGELVAYVVQAIQELKELFDTKSDETDRRIASLEARILSLEAQLIETRRQCRPND